MRFSIVSNSIVALIFLFLIAACDTDKQVSFNLGEFTEQEPLVLVIKDRNDQQSVRISDQLLQALNYTKIPYRTLDLGIISGSVLPTGRIRVLAVTVDIAQKLNEDEIDKLIEFVAEGNTLLFYTPPGAEKFNFLRGVKPGSQFVTDSVASGIKFTNDIFPGASGLSFETRYDEPHYGLTADEFGEQIQLHAVSATDSTFPVLLSNKIGLGEVFTFNTYSLYEKIHRGLFLSPVLKGLSGIPYHVTNVATIFLDDFPAPMYNVKLPPVDLEYDTTHAEFVANIWWPDMQAFADSFNIDYTAIIAFNYNAAVVPPFDFTEWRSGKIQRNGRLVDGSIYMAQNVRDSRHELGFHGYNHFSLWLKDWDNERFMLTAVQAARKRWIVDELGSLPLTYVPPTNFIDSVGLVSLKKGMPSIKYMSSLYLGDREEGGGREFGPDPYVSSLFNYPRISSGFTMKESSLYEQQMLQINTGIWTHFLHPDDVFQIHQSKLDEFASRNPLGLGWKNKINNHAFGLYHLFRERFFYTKERYPLIRYLTAEKAGAITRDWLNTFVRYKTEGQAVFLNAMYKTGYTSASGSQEKHWFVYVPEEFKSQYENVLENDVQNMASSRFWDGYLIQFNTLKDTLIVPNLNAKARFNQEELALVADTTFEYENRYRQHAIQQPEPGEYTDTRFQNAQNDLKENPYNKDLQEKVIELAVEFDQVQMAIEILEYRLLQHPEWIEKDVQRLVTYYGFESAYERAEQFLEKLWTLYPGQKVIDLKNRLVKFMGIGGPDFNTRWQSREIELITDPVLKAQKEVEIARRGGNWPELKGKLLQLLSLDSKNDTLYAHILQRYTWNEPSDSVLAFVERSPAYAQEQFIPFANTIALSYGYEKQNYTKALKWAEKVADFNLQTKLEWILAQNKFSEFNKRATEYLIRHPGNDTLRAYAGRQLIYAGYYKEGNRMLYPLFKDNKSISSETKTAVKDQIRFASYKDKKILYKQYPAFFDENERLELQRQYRKNEAVKANSTGELRTDNFDNNNARTGISAEFGNRTRIYHLIKTEELFTSSRTGQNKLTDHFYGLGYELTSRLKEGALILQTGGSAFFFDGRFKPEIFGLAGYSQDSTFTSVKITTGPVFTNIALQQDIFQVKNEIYREDPWFKGKLLTALSLTSRYYTDSVLDGEIFGRLFFQPSDSEIRFRPIIELSYANSTDPNLSGVPFYSPDNIFTQGAGFDFRYRNPNIFDYKTLFEIEVMGKNQNIEGLFVTGRAHLNHRFDNFWEITLTSELSNSKVFQSNRYFVTISYFFRTTPGSLK